MIPCFLWNGYRNKSYFDDFYPFSLYFVDSHESPLADAIESVEVFWQFEPAAKWLKDSGVSSAIARLDLESLDDPRLIVLGATHSTSAIAEVL